MKGAASTEKIRKLSIRSSNYYQNYVILTVICCLQLIGVSISFVQCDYKDFTATAPLEGWPYDLIMGSPSQRQLMTQQLEEDTPVFLFDDGMSDLEDSAKLSYLANPAPRQQQQDANDETPMRDMLYALNPKPSTQAEYYGRLLRSLNAGGGAITDNIRDNSGYHLSPPVNDPNDMNLLDSVAGSISGPLNNQLTMDKNDLIQQLIAVSSRNNSATASERAADMHNRRYDIAAGDDANDNAGYTSDNVDVQPPTTSDTENDDSSIGPRYGSIKGEYMDHPLAIFGQQQVQGGAGEGRQLLGPDGSFENVQVIKTDHAVPSYCDPPNPCPFGYTAKDGCLEHFVNSASFSREYQAKQQCACDNEHSLFNCGSPMAAAIKSSSPSTSSAGASGSDQSNTRLGVSDGDPLSSNGMKLASDDQSIVTDSDTSSDDNEDGAFSFVGAKLDTLARAIQNRFSNLASVRDLISNHAKVMDEANPNDNGGISAADRYTRPARKSPSSTTLD